MQWQRQAVYNVTVCYELGAWVPLTQLDWSTVILWPCQGFLFPIIAFLWSHQHGSINGAMLGFLIFEILIIYWWLRLQSERKWWTWNKMETHVQLKSSRWGVQITDKLNTKIKQRMNKTNVFVSIMFNADPLWSVSSTANDKQRGRIVEINVVFLEKSQTYQVINFFQRIVCRCKCF